MFSFGSKKISEAGVWVEDTDITNCQQCSNAFGLLVRRHHCRQCGQCVCGPCSTNRKFLESSRSGQLKRVCDRCFSRGDEPENLEAALARVAVSSGQSTGGASGGAAAPSKIAAPGGGSAAPAVPSVTARPDSLSHEDAIAAISEHPFEGTWEFTLSFREGAPRRWWQAESHVKTAIAH